MAASHFASSWSSFALFSVITRNSIYSLSSLYALSLSPTLSFSKCDDKKSTAAFITTRICRATKILKFVKAYKKLLFCCRAWKQRERRERKFCICLFCVRDDFCQKFVRAIFFVQKSNVKREEEENLMSFSKREKRDLKVRFQIELFSIENVY